MSTGTLRSSDMKLTVLHVTPGPDDVKLRGSRLPSTNWFVSAICLIWRY